MFNNVKVTYQNLGNNWLMILTGKEEDINLQFNSFWNHKATNSRGLDWQDLITATFWCKPVRNKKGLSLWNYFFNRRLHLLGDTFEELVKARVQKYIRRKRHSTKGEYRADFVKLCKRFERIYVGRIANQEFNSFRADCQTDFNKSFTTSVSEYNECMSQNDGEESFTPEVVKKCWTGE